ncbi:hypothetical protein FRB98_006511 [Tulasnella sp. 332]|nr:hypothetical protein FRB98_006511 [Tulasnella sp. 332]
MRVDQRPSSSAHKATNPNDISADVSEPVKPDHAQKLNRKDVGRNTSLVANRLPPKQLHNSHRGSSARQIEGNIVPERKYHFGAYADVWRGRWVQPGGPEISVAIKYLRCVKMSALASRTPEARAARIDKRLKREVFAWEQLSHPNITPLLGYRSGEEPFLVTPYYENGNLEQYLIRNPGAPKLKLLVQASKGLLYLHSHNPAVVHGDIKPDNVLINDSGEASLCDFGLARITQQLKTGLTTSGQGQGGKGFIAPELLEFEEGEGKTKYSDVYAFGGLILHVYPFLLKYPFCYVH